MVVRRAAWMLALLALAVPQSAAAAGWRAVVVNDAHPQGDSVTVVDAVTNQALTTVPVGATPLGVGITPDARTAWVANFENVMTPHPSLQPIDLTASTIAAGTAVPTGADQPVGVAITPDGTAAYSPGGSKLLKLDLTQSPATLSSITLDRAAGFIAI